MTEISNAIARSIGQNEIVTLPASSGREDELMALCDDHVQNGEIHEFWGQDEDGSEWRVHLQYEGAEQAAAES